MAISTMTSKGQTTIPKEIRRKLRLKTGDRLEYVLDDQGRVLLIPVTRSLMDLCGSLNHRAPEKAVTLKEMKLAVADEASKDYRK